MRQQDSPTEDSDQARSGLRSSGVVYLWSILGVGALLFILAKFGRYLDWDESVFFSQSGGWRSSGADPAYLAPSREGGTPALIALLRVFGLGLEGVRAAWLAIVVAIMAVSQVRMARHFGAIAGVGFVVVTGLFWTTLVFSTGLYGTLIWGMLAVLVLLEYWRAITDRDDVGLRSAVTLGLLVAAMFWMRSLESVLLVAVMACHALIWRRAFVLRQHFRWVLVSVGVFVAAYAIPWAVWSTAEWGSVGDRIEALRGLMERGGSTAGNGFVIYWGSLTSGIPQTGLFGGSPTWPEPVIAVAMLAFLALIVLALVLARDERRSKIAVLAAAVVVLALLFGGFYDTAFRDRYVAGVVPLFGALVGASLGVVSIRFPDLKSHVRRPLLVVIAAVLLAWAVAQIAIAEHYQSAWTDHSFVTQRTVETVRSLAGDRECVGAARYGAPSLQVGTGCRVQAVRNADALAAFLASESGEVVFVVWPDRLPAELVTGQADWIEVDFSEPWRSSMLYVRSPVCETPEVVGEVWGTASREVCSAPAG